MAKREAKQRRAKVEHVDPEEVGVGTKDHESRVGYVRNQLFPDLTYSRFPWMNRFFGVSIKAFTKALEAYTGLVRADRDLKITFIEHQRTENALRDLDTILETDRLSRKNALAREKRKAKVSELEDDLVREDLENQLAWKRYNKERLNQEQQKRQAENREGGDKGLFE
jgi:hypothetical protein